MYDTGFDLSTKNASTPTANQPPLSEVLAKGNNVITDCRLLACNIIKKFSSEEYLSPKSDISNLLEMAIDNNEQAFELFHILEKLNSIIGG